MTGRLMLSSFLLIISLLVKGQDLKSIQAEIRILDSLTMYSEFELAEKKADSLFLLLQHSNYQEELLKVRLQQARLLDKRDELSKALPLYLAILTEAEKNDFPNTASVASIYISLIHEKNNDFDLAYTYIKKARALCEKNNLFDLYSTILIRQSSIHRMAASLPEQSTPYLHLQKTGFIASMDSFVSLAKQAIPYAEKYQRYKDLSDSYFLIGTHFASQKKPDTAIAYYLKSITYDKILRSKEDILLNYQNIARIYLTLKDTRNALKYNDSSLAYVGGQTILVNYYPMQQRAEIFHSLGRDDSAFHYLNLAMEYKQQAREKQNVLDTKKMEEQFQSAKKEETIKNKNRQLLLLLGLLVAILCGAIVLMYKNRKIHTQNKTINQHAVEMKKTVEQKQVLLSELQHRVKNNLQYVISILEIQQESVSHSSIEEVIRSNQNRIHSIALLHKKLSLSDNVNEVDLKKYTSELSDLVKDSYQNKEKNVNLFTSCTLDILSLTKALPLGLIIVELVSNSMKHAFINKPTGIISIEIYADEQKKQNCLHYIDNGPGFDFENIRTKGLGVEIMKGLIDQLNGTIVTSNLEGFELKIYFS